MPVVWSQIDVGGDTEAEPEVADPSDSSIDEDSYGAL
jgi:hypothetical protein